MVSDPFDLGTDDVNENTTSHAPEPPPPIMQTPCQVAEKL